jgi:hypothetical protein
VISSQVIPSNNKVAIKIAIANLSIVRIPCISLSVPTYKIKSLMTKLRSKSVSLKLAVSASKISFKSASISGITSFSSLKSETSFSTSIAERKNAKQSASSSKTFSRLIS